jgi:hypothetical protein
VPGKPEAVVTGAESHAITAEHTRLAMPAAVKSRFACISSHPNHSCTSLRDEQSRAARGESSRGTSRSETEQP